MSLSSHPAVSLLQNLIRCPSVTPAEGGALALLEQVLHQAGFSVSRPVFDAPDTPSVENLWATIGHDQGPHFVFAGHTDVVPPGDENAWQHDPFSGVIDGDLLFGRGAVDMKGGVAAFVAGTLAFLDESPEFDGRLSFLITGDEEGPAVNGTVKLLTWMQEQGFAPDHCIVGEPTSSAVLGDTIKVGRRGSLSAALTVTGVQGHVAYPHMSDNPVRGMVGLLGALMAPPLDEGSARFQASNLEVTTLDVGNPTGNVTPASIEARFNIRFNDLWTPDRLEAELRHRLDRAVADNLYRSADKAPITYQLSILPGASDSFVTQSDALIGTLNAAIASVTGLVPELSTGGGTSDARFIKTYCPVVEFGLVGQTMHQVDEHTNIRDLAALTEIYKRFLCQYYASGGAGPDKASA